MQPPVPSNHPPARPLLVALGVVSTIAALGSVVGLVNEPDARWATPLLVGVFGILSTLGQRGADREHAEKLARISDDLRRNSMHYERRLDATVAALVAMREMVECADDIVRLSSIAPGPTSMLDSVRFFKSAGASRESFGRTSELLRVLADEPTVAAVDAFWAALKVLDSASEVNQVRYNNDVETYEDDEDDVRKARDGLKVAYDQMLAASRSLRSR